MKKHYSNACRIFLFYINCFVFIYSLFVFDEIYKIVILIMILIVGFKMIANNIGVKDDWMLIKKDVKSVSFSEVYIFSFLLYCNNNYLFLRNCKNT